MTSDFDRSTTAMLAPEIGAQSLEKKIKQLLRQSLNDASAPEATLESVKSAAVGVDLGGKKSLHCYSSFPGPGGAGWRYIPVIHGRCGRIMTPKNHHQTEWEPVEEGGGCI